ncbi:hypothetical protein [Halostagnicola kamekurae]|uniref:Uncharacterized protein n=1 Tax=Halostagnicola kamekurae TaxID=619731 RepID=A0A1I6Q1U4_9EURY|nr:hypothetical protein [Halostagnicola kamekurae]SFS46394.1 hypothetical protein SAMN04488556_0926 [Halostagnicola kamekurae]
MNKILRRRVGPLLAFIVFVTLVSTIVLSLISDGPVLESMEVIVIVFAGLIGFVLVVGTVLLVGVVFAFAIARVSSFLFS